MSCLVFLMENRGDGASFLCTLLSTGRNVLQKPGLESLPECAVFPGILILKLSKVELTPFPFEGPSEAGDWEPPPECGPGSCGPLWLGSPSALAPWPGCPGPSLPVSRLMQELGISARCSLAGAASVCPPPPPSLLTFGIRGSSEMSGLLGAGFRAWPSNAPAGGR